MIPYGKQDISDEDVKVVAAAMRNDFLTTGPLVEQFESRLTEFVGAPSITVSSGTAALHCAYAAIDLQPGDEVITPPITFVATQATAAMMGAKIVFADVDSESANINPDSVSAAITSRTKAIVAVDYAGNPADLDELRVLADKHKIYLIEDAAHSIGSKYKNRPVGSIADITTFSFFPTKNITTGEGGAVSSKNPHLLERARRFSRQGLIRDKVNFLLSEEGPWHQEVHEFGLNYRLPDLLCALGMSQLARIDELKSRKKEIFNRYINNLSGIDHLTLPSNKDFVDVNWHLFPAKFLASERLRIFKGLRSAGIGVQVNYLPAYRHPAMSKFEINHEDFPNSENFYRREISLPLHANLTREEIDYICSTIHNLI
jgi:dTDP-4-amino-4,6-dideoxygalactose transaminase